MGKYLTSLTLLIVLALIPTATASAHVLETDGSIGAVLHILPDDNPTSNTPITYTLSFVDTANELKLTDCNCTVTIKEGAKAIRTIPLNVTGQLDSSNTFTFPRADVYTLEVAGTPKAAGAFQPFKLTYSVRVSSGNLQIQSMPALLWAGMIGMIGLLLLAAYAMETSYNNKENSGGV